MARNSKPFIIYKATKSGKGAAMQFSIAAEKEAVFVEAAAQKGEKNFDWEKKIIMKWGLSDVGHALALLEGKTQELKLFHQTEKGNSTFNMKRRSDANRGGYTAQISKQDAETKEVSRVGISVSDDEAAILTTLLKTSVVRILKW